MAQADIPSPDDSGNTVSPEAFVYVISAERGDVKVGMAKNTARRLRELQPAHGRKLTISHETPCATRAAAYAIERHAHALLRDSALQGEWFSVAPEEAIAAVKRAISDIAEGKRREELAATTAGRDHDEGVHGYRGPEIIDAEPWIRTSEDLMRYVLGKQAGLESKHLLNFGDCIIFVGCRKDEASGDWRFFINDVSRWHMLEEDGSPYDYGRPSRSPLGNPGCALFATAYGLEGAAA